MSNYTLNHIFLRYSSHTVCGIKPASLFTVSSEDFSDCIFKNWKTVADNEKLSISVFEISCKTKMVFIYNTKWIKRIISESFVCTYLEGKGYPPSHDTEKILEELFLRLKERKSFPHEVGIFLGYPPEDVVKFEENQGKFCKYCGYWKSYCNPEEAKKCCDRYRLCSQMCTQWFDEGYSIPQIIKKYKEAALKAA